MRLLGRISQLQLVNKGVIMVVLTFYSTHLALYAEKLAKEAGLKGKLMPVPRQLSSSCGLCLRLPEIEVDRALYLLEHSGVEVDGVHPLPER